MLSRFKRSLKKSYWVRSIAWLGFYNFVDLWAILLSSRPRPTGRKVVLFVKLDGIGDYVIWTTTFKDLAKLYPSDKYKRVLIGNNKWRDLAEGQPFFDEQWFIDHDRFVLDPFYRFSVLRSVRRLGAQIVIHPRFTRSFLWEDAIVRASDADEKIGSEGINNLMLPTAERMSARWYTRLVSAPPPGQHELESHAEFLRALGLPDSDRGSNLEKSPDGMKPAGSSPAYAVLFVGASDPGKRWPAERFAMVGRTLIDRYGSRLALCGGPSDRAVADEVLATLHGDVEDLVGKQTLNELTATLAGAELVVTNDSGAGHIAAIAETPTVVLTPGNHVGRYFPYPATAGTRQVSVTHRLECFGCGWDCVYKDLDPESPKPCIEHIEVDAVESAIAAVLQ